MIAPEKALRLILKNARPLAPQTVPLADSAGRVLAEDLRASQDLPPFDNSAMDGFAVRAKDCLAAAERAPVTLGIVETVRAGSLARAKLKRGEAVKIMTGAPLPAGADAVVQKEAADGKTAGQVRLFSPPAAGDYVRRRGSDIRAGRLLLRKGARIRSYEVSLLAAQGRARVSVLKRPIVSILTTGDELVETAANLAPGKIRDSNGPALTAALARWGIAALSQGIVQDDPATLKTALKRSLRECDVLLVSGGVSVGDFDYTKTILQGLGLKEIFWKVAIKPGKPLLFGLCGEKLVFGLPGNPISALVCLEEFVRPALEKLQGLSPFRPAYPLIGKAINGLLKPKERRQYLFCQAKRKADGYHLEIILPQGSAMLSMAGRANALALSPVGTSQVKKGDTLSFRWLK